jgi:hypothetical protein
MERLIMIRNLFLLAMMFSLTGCLQFTRQETSRITEESDTYRTKTSQAIAYTTVTKPDGSSMRTPHIVTLIETEEVVHNKQTMERNSSETKQRNPMGGLSGLIGKAAGMAGIPGGDMINKFLNSGSEGSSGGLTGLGATNEILAGLALTWAAERRAASKRRAPVPQPQPPSPQGRVNGDPPKREETV